MTSPKPIAFKVFIVAISITISVFLIGILFSYYNVNKKYAIFLAVAQFLAMAFAPVGIYTGFIYKTEVKKLGLLNKLGLIGNFLIFLFTMGLMVAAAVNHATQ